MTIFMYNDYTVEIKPHYNKGVTQWWFIIDGRPVTHASKPDVAKRLACNFIDVISDEQYGIKRQGLTREYLS